MFDPLGAEVTGGYKPPHGCRESNLHAWGEEPVLCSTAPSHQAFCCRRHSPYPLRPWQWQQMETEPREVLNFQDGCT